MSAQVRLLGPQRDTSGARAAVAALVPDGPIATINAGWREREDETGELDDVLDRRMRPLELYARWRDMRAADPELDAAEVRLRQTLGEAQLSYEIRLQHALDAAATLRRRLSGSAIGPAAVADAERAVQDLDARHLTVVAGIRHDFYQQVALGERDAVGAQRRQVASLLADCAGTVITGGHVGVLLHCLHVFNLRPLLRGPVIAWSAGAMALSERVVLFGDRGARGPVPSQVYAEGLGVHTGLVCLPHAEQRLRNDPADLAQLARRFAPARCVVLDEHTVIDVDSPLPAEVRVLDPGHLEPASPGIDHG